MHHIVSAIRICMSTLYLTFRSFFRHQTVQSLVTNKRLVLSVHLFCGIFMDQAPNSVTWDWIPAFQAHVNFCESDIKLPHPSNTIQHWIQQDDLFQVNILSRATCYASVPGVSLRQMASKQMPRQFTRRRRIYEQCENACNSHTTRWRTSLTSANSN